MKKTDFLLCMIALIGIIEVTSPNANATITQTNNFNDTVVGLPVSSTDLLQTNLSSLTTTGAFNGTFNNFSGLTNGLLGTPGTTGGSECLAPWAVGALGTNLAATLTFNLNTTSSPTGYDIFSIDTFASWNSNRDGQEYSVLYAKASAPTTFLPFYSIAAFNPASPADPRTTQVRLTESGAGVPLITNVAAIQFKFDGPVLAGGDTAYTMYREIDVSGQASLAAPEPTTLALFAVGGMGFVARLRRLRNK
jgi:PEP-CTERM motif